MHHLAPPSGSPWVHSILYTAAFQTLDAKRAFAVVGPSIWNDLPLSIRSLPRNRAQPFLSQLKVVLFARAGVGSVSE